MGSTGIPCGTDTGPGLAAVRVAPPLRASVSFLHNGYGPSAVSFLLLLQLALPGPQASPLAPGPQDHWEEVGQAKKEQN